MSSISGAVFRIPVLGWSAALLVIFSPTLVLGITDLQREHQRSFSSIADALLFPVALFVIFTAYSFWVFRLEITPAGMRMYRVNHALWEDITSARAQRFLFLPYLYLTRRKGMAWWVPLYFVGPGRVAEALLRYSPEGHPVRYALQGERSLARDVAGG
ncbi:MAG TPA: hypothetical protein VFT45_02595 [Longimicrobium sp.]|nr:hypothetical protein [Longimicrobium sp.]